MKTKIQITVGVGYRADGSTIPLPERNRLLGIAQDHLIATYGGFTRLDTTGGWKSKEWDVVEPGVIFVVLDERPEGDAVFAFDSARRAAEVLKNLFQQQSVILEVSQVNAEFI